MPQRLTSLLFLISALFLTSAVVAEDENRAAPAPAGVAWWWNDAWWEQGQIPAATNYPLETRWVSYMSGDTEIPALVAGPRGKGRLPAGRYTLPVRFDPGDGYALAGIDPPQVQVRLR